ncbi:MAG TPA: Tol-Pal system beta propeller repeat protein TolB [Deltaproteobacteria bacterium]|nr:Tol-Pal system beta propeller repeat protein TolB [Deltaproteobacteria bacterium]
MRYYKLLCLVVFFLIPLQTQAAIYILIDQFSPERKFPIAVADLVEKSSGQTDARGVEIADILRKNLKLAGYFDIVDKSRYLDRSATLLPEEVDFAKWTSVGATVFVKGAYQSKGNKLSVELRLYDPSLKQMLVGKEYKVPKDKAYAAVHRFADEIMLALTGERGIFNTKIAAACGPRGKEQIVIMNVDGSEREALTNNGTMNLSPNWSPGGTELVYTSYAKFFPELFTVSVKKSKAKRLTFNNTLNITPSFSPDGSQIAFSSSMSGDPDIYRIDPQGKNSVQLTRSAGIDISPTWSPDGNLIAFASERAGNLHLFVTDKNGGEPKRLTFTGYQNDTPEWSPRGDKIAYVKRSEGGFDVFLMNADGSAQQQLTSASGNNENPGFSPDGRYLVFSSSRDRGSNLYLMMWDGSNQTAITTDGQCKTADWSNSFEGGKK